MNDKKMVYLTIPDLAMKSVANSRMLLKGGGTAPGRYLRRAKNIVSSAGLLKRMDWTAVNMRANCSLNDKCVPVGMTSMAVGQPVPGGRAGVLYTNCTDEERARRLDAARTCAISTLATRGGVYSRAG